MYNKVSRIALLGILQGLLLVAGGAMAQEKSWMYAGPIDRVDAVQQKIMVNDLEMQLTGSSRLLSAKGTPITTGELKVGTVVGVNFAQLPGTGRVLVELQVYPRGKKPRLDNEDE